LETGFNHNFGLKRDVIIKDKAKRYCSCNDCYHKGENGWTQHDITTCVNHMCAH